MHGIKQKNNQQQVCVITAVITPKQIILLLKHVLMSLTPLYRSNRPAFLCFIKEPVNHIFFKSIHN